MSCRVTPPIAPMLAALSADVPVGDYLYEPKWDGFRCLGFVCGGEVDLRSRNQRPLGRYFPELVDAFRRLPDGTVVDGEIVATRDGRPDFGALLERIHPAASRVATLSAQTPATYHAFDLLAHDGGDHRDAPFGTRRAVLERLVDDRAVGIDITDATRDPTTAIGWLDDPPDGCDGVVAKPLSLRYEPGRRVLTKVKRDHTCDCVVAGARLDADATVRSLLLGLYDVDGTLHHPGVVTSMPRAVRAEVAARLPDLAVPLERHPWRAGFNLEGGATGRLKGSGGRWTPDMTLDWLPLAPALVVEVAFDRLDALRFRHPARFRRWRPDRDPAGCLLHQLAVGR